jgi:ABC-type sugar transport system ATPase subunit
MARGLVLLAGDRQAALVPELDVTQNITLAALDRFVRRGFVDRPAERAAAEEASARYRVRAPSLRVAVRALSGGNQQKVLLARAALARPAVLLLDEPTRGVDVAAKAEIYQAIFAWADQGAAVLMTTSDTDELLELADRIVVLHRGKVAATLRRGATREQVVAAAVGSTSTSDDDGASA